MSQCAIFGIQVASAICAVFGSVSLAYAITNLQYEGYGEATKTTFLTLFAVMWFAIAVFTWRLV